MAAPVQKDLSTAVAQGDFVGVDTLIRQGVDIDEKSKDGMTPLSIAAFWGYADIAKRLLESGADVNIQNSGTRWTPLHCAAFQGHGPVVMRLMQKKPHLTMTDSKGRTAADFASALDSIWPFFSAAGCKRTNKPDLIRMDIVQKITYHEDPNLAQEDLAHFSRPGSAYGMRPQQPGVRRDRNTELAAVTGDVLASLPEEPTSYRTSTRGQPHLLVWDN